MRNALADDQNDTDKSMEIDDLASFGPLTSPDTEDSGFACEGDPAEADLASLAFGCRRRRQRSSTEMTP